MACLRQVCGRFFKELSVVALIYLVDTYLAAGGRRRYVLLLPTLLLLVLVLWPALWWYIVRGSWSILPTPVPSHQYRMNRSLQHYLEHVDILIEPKVVRCGTGKEEPVIIMVATTSPRIRQRIAVRGTWAMYQPTFFVMGVYGNKEKQLIENRDEAHVHDDLLVFDFRDHHENQTLKTALMMKWTAAKCPQTHFMLKTQDDVMVNPWMLNKVMWHNLDNPIIGYALNDTHLLKNEYRMGYNPGARNVDENLTYLSGTGYLIKGEYIDYILQGALRVPMMNLEDIYFTYLVARKQLGMSLTHDRRLSPYKPWLKTGCVYWGLASIHGLTPTEMYQAWSCVEILVTKYKTIAGVCKNFNYYFDWFKDLVLY